MEMAPEEFDIKANLQKAITLLTQRNKLLTVPDSNAEVFEFYDQHAKAETFQAPNPILAAFLREEIEKKKVKFPNPLMPV